MAQTANMAAMREQRRERELQRDHEEKQRLYQEAFNANGDLKKDWMEDLLGFEDIEERFDPLTLKKIRGLLTRQRVLANLTDAEAHDARFKQDVMQLKIYGEHPPQESSIQGPLRAYLLDDEGEGVFALTAAERNAIDQIIDGLKDMVTRGRGGFERKQMNTSIAATRNERSRDGESKSGLRGLFSS